MKLLRLEIISALFAFCALSIRANYDAWAQTAKPEGKPAASIVFADALKDKDGTLYKDFGKVPEGQDKKFEYLIGNSGTADLKIVRLFSPCGCIKLKMDRKVIPPGQTEKIRGLFITKGRWGDQDKLIQVYSNDPKPISNLKCRLKIDSGVRVSSRNVSFGEIKSTRSVEKTVTLESRLEQKLRIKSVKVVGTDLVKAKAGRPKDKATTLPNGKSGYHTVLKIELTLSAKKMKSDFSGKVEIETNALRNPKITILISGEKTGELTVEPNPVFFRLVPLGKTATAQVTVKGLKKGDFRVLGLDAGEVFRSDGVKMPVTLKAKSETPQREHKVQLVFTAPEVTLSPSIRGPVYIVTDHPTQKRVKITVNATIERSP